MPHCVIEYSKDLDQAKDLKALCTALHDTLMATELWQPSAIKVRAESFETYLAGGEVAPFIHVTTSLLEGRPLAKRQALSKSLLASVKAFAPEVPHISVEVREMNPETYSK